MTSDVLMELLKRIEEKEDRLKKLEGMIARLEEGKVEELGVRWLSIREFSQQIGERKLLDEVRF